MLPTQSPAANDVYQRFGLSWAEFPTLVTPSAHADEVELFCAKQSLAVYGTYPDTPHAPAHDYIPSQQREAISTGTFSAGRMIGGGADGPAATFEPEQGYRIVTSDQASALFVWKGPHLIIAFRGTANWQDWIHNFTAETISTDLVDVEEAVHLHKGFTGLSENIAPAVEELIAEYIQMYKARSPMPILTFCGHSLGGALALNFAARLQRRTSGPYGIDGYSYWIDHRDRVSFRLGATYTFGAPCIGKGQVWKFIRRPHYRLIVRRDPVPLTPPGYSSDFQATYLDEATQPPVQPPSTAGKIWKAVVTRVTPKFNLSFSSHDIEVYIQAIEQKIGAKAHKSP